MGHLVTYRRCAGFVRAAFTIFLVCLAHPAAASPKPLTFGGDLDPVLQKNCGTPGGLRKETLSKDVAAASGYPEGEIGTFDCKLRDGGAASWVTYMGAGENKGGIYNITVYGSSAKKLLKDGALFAKPVLSDAGRKRLAAAMASYSRKPSDDGAARWEIDGVAFHVMPVFGGPYAGQLSLGITRAE